MDDDALLAAAKAYRDESEQLRLRRIAEFETTLPTPNLDECNRAAAGQVVPIKQWDLAPIDPQSFDPFEPPGRPAAPPLNTVLPAVSGTPQLGSTLNVSTGTWSAATTYAYQWLRNGTNVAGATAATRLLAAADVGALMSCRVTATGPGGSTPAVSNSVGPVIDPAAGDSDDGGDGETVQPTRRRR